MSEITHDDLKALVSYDPETGIFTRRHKKGRWADRGRAGGLHQMGYRQITIGRRRYFEHRVAWFYVYGAWPENDIDHINRDRADNRIANLREATRSQNNVNRPGADRPLPKGVYLNRRGAFRSYICWKRKMRTIGTFESAEEARAAYIAEAKRLYGEFAWVE